MANSAAAESQRHVSLPVEVTELNFRDLSPFVPSTESGHKVWLVVWVTWKGAVTSSKIYDTEGGLEELDDESDARLLDPRSAARLIREVEGFETQSLRHVSISATYAMHSEVQSSHEEDQSAAAQEPVPVQQAHDQYLLSRLEVFTESAAFIGVVEDFASEPQHLGLRDQRQHCSKQTLDICAPHSTVCCYSLWLWSIEVVKKKDWQGILPLVEITEPLTHKRRVAPGSLLES